VPEWDDLCVSTLTAPTVDILRELGVWRSLSVAAAPFCDMQVWGADDGYVRFDATAVGQAVMGHVLEDSLLKAALHDQLRARGSTVQLMMPATAVAADLPPYSPAAQVCVCRTGCLASCRAPTPLPAV
jgi:2-polyprenyl-6-methoxyphenol hydroxylase-like FAD-dependent oxidoreductase